MREAEIYRKLEGEQGFAKFYGHCLHESSFFIILERLHHDLSYCFHNKRANFTEAYVYGLGLQMFQRIQSLHGCGYVHRDLKPSQFLIKRRSSDLYLVDFNLSRKYPKSFAFTTQGKGGIVGNAVFASVSAHSTEQQTRRDDCESILYIIIYLLKGSLPWQGLLSKGREKMGTVVSLKSRTMPHDLCSGLPTELATMLGRVRAMAFEETPDYRYFKGTLEMLMRRHTSIHPQGLDVLPSLLGSLESSSQIQMTGSLRSSVADSPSKIESGHSTFPSTNKRNKPIKTNSVEGSLLKLATKKLKRNLPQGINRDVILKAMEFCDEPAEPPPDEPPVPAVNSEKCLVF
jgi:serine/threonine protein kinase